MKKLIICRIALSFLPCWATIPNGAQAEEDLVNLIKNVKPAVVLVQIFNASGRPIGQGSGFFIDNKGRVVTNHHVIKGAYSATVKTSAGKEFPVEGIIAQDSQADIAKLAVNIADSNIVPLKLSTTIPSEGETVVVIGSPLGLEASVSSGIVSAVRDIPAFGKVLQITAPVSPGSSGSPVMNAKGDVIGVATFILTKGQNLNFAVSSEKILALKETPTIITLRQYARETSKKDPNDPESLVQAGLKELWQANYEGALAYFQEATTKNPKYPEAWFYVGCCHYMLGRHQEALDSFKRATKIMPDYPVAYYNIGVIYRDLGVLSDATEAYELAIKFKPDYADAHDGLGSVYLRLERYQQAIECFQLAIKFDQTFAGAYNNLANAYLRGARYAEAVEAAREAIRIEPNLITAHVELGIAYERLGRHQDAIDTYEKLIGIRTPQGMLYGYMSLGLLYGKLSRYQEAIESYKQAINVKPDLVEAHLALGNSYSSLAQYQESIEVYKQAIALNPNFAPAHYRLGFVYTKTGNLASAEEEYKILKTLKSPAAERLRDLIDKRESEP